jgi:uncharacterized protein (DUF2225 family)
MKRKLMVNNEYVDYYITVFRIEHEITKDGMWYDINGIFTNKIQIICPNALAKDFPMDYNEIYKAHNTIWQSSGKSIENMNEWFSKQDAINLHNAGLKLYELDVQNYIELENEILFDRNSIVNRREITISKIWN